MEGMHVLCRCLMNPFCQQFLSPLSEKLRRTFFCSLKRILYKKVSIPHDSSIVSGR